MWLRSDSFAAGAPIPSQFAMGQPSADGFGFAENRNPRLAWGEVPPGTRSFVLMCVDPDVPTVPEMVGKADVEIPAEQPRCDFVHWLMIDIPADCREIAAGSCSAGVTVGGKQVPEGPVGARQGLNDYTAWFAGDARMAGDYRGYDGPFPPPNDLRVHRYFFRLFALDRARLDVPERFTVADALRAMHAHVLTETAIFGVYSLHPRVAKSFA